MKCPQCGVATDVLHTRVYKEVFVKRTRKCHNEHRFVTVEVLPGNLDLRTLDATIRGVKARQEARRRQKVATMPGYTATEAARILGITEARVRQIRRGV